MFDSKVDLLPVLEGQLRTSDSLCDLTREMTTMCARIADLEVEVKKGREQTDRMVDKLIEMALVTSGNPREALAARRLIPANTPLQTIDEPEEDDSDWFRMP